MYKGIPYLKEAYIAYLAFTTRFGTVATKFEDSFIEPVLHPLRVNHWALELTTKGQLKCSNWSESWQSGKHLLPIPTYSTFPNYSTLDRKETYSQMLLSSSIAHSLKIHHNSCPNKICLQKILLSNPWDTNPNICFTIIYACVHIVSLFLCNIKNWQMANDDSSLIKNVGINSVWIGLQ